MIVSLMGDSQSCPRPRTEAVPYEAQAAGMPWDWESFPEWLDLCCTCPGLGVEFQDLQEVDK